MSQNIEIERRLAAVLAADVAGFSRLTEADEVGTMRMLATQRAILDNAIARHRGRIANTAGDSVLAEFPSAVNAVQCAVEAQQALRDAAEGAPADRRVLFRIGIHVGDVMVRGGDLLGTGVNVAARLEVLADAGGIVLSAAAHEQVKKILPLAYTDLGPQSVKNIEEPVRAFAIGATQAASVAIPNEGKPLPLPDKPSIAVLPFQNMSGDPEQEYFANGMVEDIITALSRFKQLFVIARNSSFTYKGKPVNIKQVGRELGVRYVLEGSVRKAGGRVRITGQLIEAVTGNHVWANRYDGMIEDVFDLQDRIVEQVISAISFSITTAEIERSRQKRPEALDAYDHLLRGQALIRRLEYGEALLQLEKAIELQPDYAYAHSLAADCYTSRYILGATTNLAHDKIRALDHAHKALALDKDHAGILCSASMAIFNFDPDNAEDARKLIERATVLGPNVAWAWFLRGAGDNFRGDPQKAFECLTHALRLTPVGPLLRLVIMQELAIAFILRGQPQEAVTWAEQCLQERHDHPLAIYVVAAATALAGDLERAKAMYKRIAERYPAMRERHRRLYHRPEDFAKLDGAMRLAGAPE